MAEISDVMLGKIKKMMAVEASLRGIGTEEALNEAAVAATKIAEFCLRHKIELSQVEMQTGQARQVDIDREAYRYDGTEEYRASTKLAWEINLAVAVSRAHDCRVLVGRGYFVFIGESEDRAVAMEMFRILRHEVTTACTKEYRRARRLGIPTKGFIASFFITAVGMIQRRYMDMRRAVIEETNSTALVLRTDRALDDYVDSLNLKKDTTKVRGAYNNYGASQGKEFGSRVSLSSTALGENEGSPKQLTGR